MTASGLPLGLEKCLSALLQENTLSSWRIFANDSGDHTVTIRLNPRVSPSRYSEQHTGGWYKKGYARVKRDRERWTQHQNKLKSDNRNASGIVDARPQYSHEDSVEQTRDGDLSDEVCSDVHSLCSERGLADTESTKHKHLAMQREATSFKAGTNAVFSNNDQLSPVRTCVSENVCVVDTYDPTVDTTQRQYPSLFPDMFSAPCKSTCTQQSEIAVTQRPSPSPPDPAARESRSDGEEAMEATEGGTRKGTGVTATQKVTGQLTVRPRAVTRF